MTWPGLGHSLPPPSDHIAWGSDISLIHSENRAWPILVCFSCLTALCVCIQSRPDSHRTLVGKFKVQLQKSVTLRSQLDSTLTGTFLVVQGLRLHLPMQGVRVWSLVGKLRSFQQNQNFRQSNIVTNSIKTLKLAHIKKNLKKKKERFYSYTKPSFDNL